MLRKLLASGIVVVAIAGVATAPASARHKKMSTKHHQTTGMSSSSTKAGAGPGMSGSGTGSGQAAGTSSGAGGTGGASSGGNTK